MNNWRLIEDKRARTIWNVHLAQFEDCSPFQTFQWGQYNKALGWEPLHFASFDENEKITAMAMVLVKRYFFRTGFAWVQGGPVGDLEAVDERLPRAIIESSGLKRLYLRFRSDRKRTTRDALFLEHKRWSRSMFRMGSSFSLELDLDGEIGDIDRNFRGSWRRNLKLSKRDPLIVRKVTNPEIEELDRAFSEMEAAKGLAELFSRQKLENLFRHLPGQMILYRCEDAEGHLLSFRGVLFIGHRAVEYMGVTNDRGRDLRASYPLVREILRHCHKVGITKFDLGGIDPWENPGCHSFKRGTGGKELEYLGEWDWASSTWLRWFCNWAIQKRQSSKKINSGLKSKSQDSGFGRIYGSATAAVRQIAGILLR